MINLICLLLPLFSASRDAAIKKNINYDFSKPSKVYTLPPILHEVSGISSAEPLIACVQDEQGVVFFYEPGKNDIVRQQTFGPDGDYEDVTHVNNDLFVLRSDGLLYQVPDKIDKQVAIHFTGIPARNSEGLCYDEQNNRLLIAVKGRSGKGKYFKDLREVFAFDLKKKMLDPRPLLRLDVNDVKAFASEKGIVLPVKYKKKGQISEQVLRLTTSALAIHPITGDFYLLSSTDHMLLILDNLFRMKEIVQLDAFNFNKPEGMTFDRKGNLMISNEGVNKQPTIYTFDFL